MHAFAIAVLGLACSGTTATAGVLDQSAPSTNTGFNMSVSSLEWQQEVVVGIAGRLDAVEFFVNGPGSCTFYVTGGAPWQSGAPGFSTTFTGLSTGWTSIDVSGAGLVFGVGDHLVLGLKCTDGGLGLGGSEQATGSAYPAGELFLNGGAYSGGHFDIGFKTYVAPAPGAIGAASAAAIVCCRRRRR